MDPFRLLAASYWERQICFNAFQLLCHAKLSGTSISKNNYPPTQYLMEEEEEEKEKEEEKEEEKEKEKEKEEEKEKEKEEEEEEEELAMYLSSCTKYFVM